MRPHHDFAPVAWVGGCAGTKSWCGRIVILHRFFVAKGERIGQGSGVGPRTHELLYVLLWTCETLMRPTFRNLTESYESWAYRRGFLWHLDRLQAQQFVERREGGGEDRLYRLTDAGRLLALGGRDPEARWKRGWDGRWRLVAFDVPEARRSARNQLRRYLRSRGFGCLQGSVWITPDPVVDEGKLLAHGTVNVESLVVLEARPCSGETDAEMIAGAWNFEEIKRRYVRYRETLDRRPQGPIKTAGDADALVRWTRAERTAWAEVMEWDPLLPERLLPPGYLGRKAWREREKAMRKAGAQMRGFRPASG